MIRSDLSNDLSGDETGIREVAESTRLHVVELLTVRDVEMVALCLIEAVHRRNASVIIVPDIEHADGIDCLVRDRVRLVTTAGERILARSGLGAKLAGVLDPS